MMIRGAQHAIIVKYSSFGCTTSATMVSLHKDVVLLAGEGSRCLSAVGPLLCF